MVNACRAYFRWTDYVALLDHLRRATDPGTPVANATQKCATINWPVARPSPFRFGPHLTWIAYVRPDELQPGPIAGIHFLVFNPSSDDFHRNRLAMDGVLPGGKIPFLPRARGQGFNAVLRTTHRQNFLVPPRRHRSFPLA